MLKEQSVKFSITKEEIEQLEREYEINNIIVHLYKALNLVKADSTITEAINKLLLQTRFANDIKQKWLISSNLMSHD